MIGRTVKWAVALAISLSVHIAAAAFFHEPEQQVKIAGGSMVRVSILGSAFEDMVQSGAKASDVSPAAHDPVEPDRTPNIPIAPDAPLQEAPTPTRHLEPGSSPLENIRSPAASETSADRPEQVSPQPPEITSSLSTTELATLMPAPPRQRPEPALRPTLRPEPTAQLKPAQSQPAQKPTQQAALQPVETQEPLLTKPPLDKPREPPRKKKQAAGNKGNKEQNAKRGNLAGKPQTRTSNADASRRDHVSVEGNAAASNYPGQVVSKLRRSLRYPREAKRQNLRGEAMVHFEVLRGGDLSALRLMRSSGSPVLDQAALETVRRAAPFPAIPMEARRASWTFTLPIAFTR